MTQRSEQRLKTRQHLLAIARQLFERQGIAATRTLDVANAAGVSHGTVFAHFPTREDLVEAVVEGFATDYATRLGAAIPPEGGVREVLAAQLRAIAEAETLYTRVIVESAQLPAPARGAWLGAQAVLSRRLAAAVQRERLRPMAFPLLFNTWLGLLHHYLANRDLFCPEGSLVERKGDELLNHFLGLLAE